MGRTTPEEDIYTDGQLLIITSQYNPAFIIDFKQLIPIGLSGLQFDARMSDAEYMTATVTFKHQRFFILDKNNRSL
jgi:hypothetical protein